MLLKTYSIETDFPSGLITSQLHQEISESGYVTGYEGVQSREDDLEIYGSSMNESSLDSLISAHTPDMTVIYVKAAVKENKEFADQMMQRLKEKNLLEGLSSIDQAAWVHHKLRKMDFTLSDDTTVVQLDLMNLVVSGDIETAEHALGQMPPDDMTESYHWLTQARIDWIRNEIRTYLGWPLI